LEIILRQRHEGFVTPWPCLSIALDAADEPLAVVVDLDQRAMAVGSVSSMELLAIRTLTVVYHRK